MVIRIDDDFDLDKIADSRQCFRWEKQGTSSVILKGDKAASYTCSVLLSAACSMQL